MVTLREVRAERMLSIRELAKLAEVAPSTIYLIEAGRSRPRLSVARRIAEVLGERPQDIQEFQRTISAAKVYVPRGTRQREDGE